MNSLTRITGGGAAASTLEISAKDPAFGAVGNGTADDTVALQAWIDALPTGGHGRLPSGRYRITADLIAQPNATRTNLQLEGSGNIGQHGVVGMGASVIEVDGAGLVGLRVGSTSSTQFQGIMLRNLHFHDKNGTAAGGVLIRRQNNVVIENVGCSDFATGYGIHSDGTGNVNQYWQVINPSLNNCQVGLKHTATNGLRVVGGMIDANSNSGAPAVGSTGIQIVSGDTFRGFGTVIQFAATGVSITTGEAHELHGFRIEGCTTGIDVTGAATSTKVMGGSVNNFISGGTGTGIKIAAAATKTMVMAPYIIAVTTKVDDLAADTTSIIDNQVILKQSGGVFQIGDAKLIRDTLGQLRALDSINSNLHMTIGRGSNTPGTGRLFFGSAQDAGLQRSAVGVVAPNTGTLTALGAFTTAARPSASASGAGASYYDTTLGKPGWSDGTAWRDAATTTM